MVTCGEWGVQYAGESRRYKLLGVGRLQDALYNMGDIANILQYL